MSFSTPQVCEVLAVSKQALNYRLKGLSSFQKFSASGQWPVGVIFCLAVLDELEREGYSRSVALRYIDDLVDLCSGIQPHRGLRAKYLIFGKQMFTVRFSDMDDLDTRVVCDIWGHVNAEKVASRLMDAIFPPALGRRDRPVRGRSPAGSGAVLSADVDPKGAARRASNGFTSLRGHDSANR